MQGWAFAQAPVPGAQNWPSRPLRFIVPFPPGGGTDVNARIIAPRLAAALGQQVVVENRTGAGGMVGTEVVAKSAPDGYSMVIATIGPIAINQSLYSKMTYDPAKDLAPVTITGEVPNGLVAGTVTVLAMFRLFGARFAEPIAAFTALVAEYLVPLTVASSLAVAVVLAIRWRRRSLGARIASS